MQKASSVLLCFVTDESRLKNLTKTSLLFHLADRSVCQMQILKADVHRSVLFPFCLH